MAKSGSPTFYNIFLWSWAFPGFVNGCIPVAITSWLSFQAPPPVEQGGQLLLWDVHQDTVPADGMTVDPFGGEYRDGRIYGRGACDVKGAMAAIVSAIVNAASEKLRPSNSPTIVVAFTVNEECGFTVLRHAVT